MNNLTPLSKEERETLKNSYAGGPTYSDMRRALHTIDVMEQASDQLWDILVERGLASEIGPDKLRSLKSDQKIHAACEQRQARLVEALKAKNIRLRDLFDRHERKTYHENSNPDSDLELLLADGSDALREIEEKKG